MPWDELNTLQCRFDDLVKQLLQTEDPDERLAALKSLGQLLTELDSLITRSQYEIELARQKRKTAKAGFS